MTSAPLGGVKWKSSASSFGLLSRLKKRSMRGLAEVVDDLDCVEPVPLEADPDLEPGLLVLRLRTEPVEPVLGRRRSSRKSAPRRPCRRSARRASRRARGSSCACHLVQVRVVDPDSLAVADDDLLVGLGESSGSGPGARTRSCPSRPAPLLRCGRHDLHEIGAPRLRLRTNARSRSSAAASASMLKGRAGQSTAKQESS